ncbi:MAG TPA: hypothetical protein VN025_20510 [Candidatus Dormibacteraeota bacterium]|jgi:hypothetical protein|nr:hypothetical protein [Candidatus Dormibacteraeota bacterium]
MKRYLGGLLFIPVMVWMAACGSSSGQTTPVVVNVSGAFTTIQAGGQPVTLTASVGVSWVLSIANTNCSPGCGTLSSFTSNSVVYTPPATVPVNQQATITARSLSDNQQAFVFNFQIVPPITLSIAPKFSTQTAGGAVVDLTATVSNDVSNAGVTWSLTAGGTDCTGPCGTLTVDPAPSLTAHYQPPATVPTGANATPKITATSVADSTKSDSFTFTITAPAIAVVISNKFSTVGVGASPITINVNVNNDAANAGVTWTLTTGGNACSPACGTLIPSSAPSFSAAYTAPTTLPAGPNASPTITATSVTDATKNDSFSFNVVNLSSLFTGSYAFQVRGFDTAGLPMTMAGSITSDGAGNITAGELDYTATATVINVPSLSGTYTVDNSFKAIPRVTIDINTGSSTFALKCALTSDGKRGKIIEFDDSLRLNAGTILQQDTASLTAANAAGSYAFALDSDRGVSGGGAVTGRIVEVGQFTIGTGATGITGGVADAAQTGAPAVLIGTGATPATIASDVAAPPDASGRGTFTLTISGNSNQYAYYMVNSQQLNLIEIDSGGTFGTIQSGTAQKQKSLTANSLNATSVAALTGAHSSGGTTATDVIVGVLNVTGGTSATATYDFNRAGTVNAGQVPATSTIGAVFGSFDPTTGRYILVNGFFFGAAVYLYDNGQGFMIDITQAANGTNDAFSGPLIAQTESTFSTSDIPGNYIGLAGGSSTSGIPNLDFAANFDASGGYSAVVDFTTPDLTRGVNGQAQDVLLDTAFFGLAYQLNDTTLGRGLITFPAGVFNDFNTPNDVFGVFYMIGPRQFVAIGQGPLGNGVDSSGILFFDPQ